MHLRKFLLAVGTLAATAVVSLPVSAQESPLTGRWTFFDLGTRSVTPNELQSSCMTDWDSIAPDGSLVGYSMDEGGLLTVHFAGFCEVNGSRVFCQYLLDSEQGVVNDTEEGEIEIIRPDVIDYFILGPNGKPDREASWTYFRCPPSAGFSVG
ncbi:MAG: hypothetical protein AAF414_12980 [Pseudomonadota bacterium]